MTIETTNQTLPSPEQSARATTPESQTPVGPERSARASNPGPVTEAGKAISSRNALKHGLRATKAENAIDPALQSQFDALKAEYLQEYNPQGPTENTLLDLIVLSVWQLYKVAQMELFTELDFGTLGSFGQSEKLARYRSAHERTLHRNLNQMKQIQQERLAREVHRTAAIPAEIPPGVKLKPLHQLLHWLEKYPKTRTAAADPTNPSPKPATQSRKPTLMPRQ